jgi:hypothetical protein
MGNHIGRGFGKRKMAGIKGFRGACERRRRTLVAGACDSMTTTVGGALQRGARGIFAKNGVAAEFTSAGGFGSRDAGNYGRRSPARNVQSRRDSPKTFIARPKFRFFSEPRRREQVGVDVADPRSRQVFRFDETNRFIVRRFDDCREVAKQLHDRGALSKMSEGDPDDERVREDAFGVE